MCNPPGGRSIHPEPIRVTFVYRHWPVLACSVRSGRMRLEWAGTSTSGYARGTDVRKDVDLWPRSLACYGPIA
ncbi:hypothetical protein MABM_25420 [Mycobacteroides abscessus]|nr:hypothetical protein MABM_25420 [Mycobacteroides abscessus]